MKTHCDFCRGGKGKPLYKFDLAFNKFIFVCSDCLADAVKRKWNTHIFIEFENKIIIRCDKCSQPATHFVDYAALCDDH